MSEFLSPDIRYIERDITQSVEGSSTSTAAVLVTSSRGPVGIPTLRTRVQDWLDTFGRPKAGDVSSYGALGYYVFGNRLWTIRVAGAGHAYASSVLRALEFTVSIASGDGSASVQMAASATYNDSTTSDVTANAGISWSVANGTGQATVDSSGLVTGVSAGTVEVTATYQGLSQTVTVNIVI